MLLELITLGIGAYSIAGMVSSSKTALIEKRIEERGNLNVEESFEDILKLCRVKYTADLFIEDKNVQDVLVLEEGGYSDCLDFIRQQPLTTGEDEKKFIQIYNQKRQEGLKRRKEYFEENYQKCKRRYYRELNESSDLVTFTFTKEHFQHIPPENHFKLVNDLYHDTFLGQIATKPGKIVLKEHMGRWVPIEVWQFTLPSKFGADSYYKACCKRLGYSGIGI